MDIWNNKLPPFNKHLGIKITEWEENRVVLTVETRPEYCNNSGIPHGGFIGSLLDMATGHAGIFCPLPGNIRKALTLSLNINFMGQAQSNSLRIIGTVTGSGRKIFYSAASVYDDKGTLIASGQAVCRYRTGSEDLEGEPMAQD